MYNIYHDLVINAPLQKVFEALSQPTDLVHWSPLKCSGTLQKNESYNFYFSPQYNWFAKVLFVEAPYHFHIQMTDADDDWNPTSFGFDLEEIENGALVSFWHKGWPACNAHFKRSSYCWALLLNGLKKYVENGTIIPFEELA